MRAAWPAGCSSQSDTGGSRLTAPGQASSHSTVWWPSRSISRNSDCVTSTSSGACPPSSGTTLIASTTGAPSARHSFATRNAAEPADTSRADPWTPVTAIVSASSTSIEAVRPIDLLVKPGCDLGCRTVHRGLGALALMDETFRFQTNQGFADGRTTGLQFARQSRLTGECGAAARRVKPDPADAVHEYGFPRSCHVGTLSYDPGISEEAAMAPNATGTLDEAYRRLHATGPEFQGWLSNHGPMATDAIVRRGHPDRVRRWLDGYMRRLEEFPRGYGPIGTSWQEALGDPRRVADWTSYFRREASEQPWRQVLGTWWPRLLPGVAAAATHGVIRVGHAVRALTEDGADADHLTELA